jgi:hypothetical protein
MNEHGFIKSVHRHLPADTFSWKIHDTYTGGVPDAMYAGPARILFVEYKYLKLPKKETTLIKTGLSALQLQWLDKMHLYNVAVAVIIGSSSGSIVLTGSKWHQELFQKDFEDALNTKQLSNWIYRTINERKLPNLW